MSRQTCVNEQAYIVNIRKVATRCKMKINMAVWPNTCRPAAVAHGYTTFCCWARGHGLDSRPRLPHCDRGGMQKRSWPPRVAEISPTSPTTASVIAGVSFFGRYAQYFGRILAQTACVFCRLFGRRHRWCKCFRVYGRLWEQLVRRSGDVRQHYVHIRL